MKVRLLFVHLILVVGLELLLKSRLVGTWCLLKNSVLRLGNCLTNRKSTVLIIIWEQSWCKTWY
ncbi:hypothetical protein HanRHA438_Chr17g0813451 [Helianthus annuus]|nr:hypothetical protein HanRHA438_Chr17g0813451 [Helianthus annuus]